MGTKPAQAARTGAETGTGGLFPLLAAGLVAGLDGIVFAVAVASLLFTGPLQDGLAMGTGAALLCTIIMAALVGTFSTLTRNIAQVQDMGVAVLAATLGATAGAIASGAEARVATAFVIIALSSAAAGLLLWFTGWRRAGRIVKFFPLEVLAGFMAGTGWLLVTGAMSMVTGAAPTLAGWGLLLNAESLRLFLPTLIFGIVLHVGMSRFSHPLTLLGLLLGGVASFYLWLHVSGGTVDQAAAAGYLPRIDGAVSLGFPFPAMLWQADWSVVAGSIPSILTVALLCLFAVLMNTSALELASGQEADMDKELRVTGYGNLLVAGAGGPPGYSGLAISVLAAKLGVGRRGVGLVTAGVVLVGFAFSQEIVAHVPQFVNAGLILYFGIDLLKDWLAGTRRRYSPREWSVVVLIVLIVATYGFLQAIIAGFLVATILFAWSYANVPVVRNETTIAALPSTIERPPPDADYLAAQGNRVKIIQLQGFLFFGTAENLIQPVRHASASATGGMNIIVLDFTQVTRIDSASAGAIGKLKVIAGQAGFTLMLCGVSAHVLAALNRAGLSPGGPGSMMLFDTLDQALEHAENLLLAERKAVAENHSTLMARHGRAGNEAEFAALLAMMERRHYLPGERIIGAGSAADGLCFLERGRAAVFLPRAAGERRRLRTMGAGAILGDVAFSLQVPRTADVVAEEDCSVLSLSARQLECLETEQPALALALQRILSRALAEKVIAANRITDHIRG